MLRISRAPIDPGSFAEASDDGAGASVTFLGTVRAHGDDGRAVAGLAYEAYEPMAVAEFERIAAEARERFGARQVAIVHRVGDVAVGDIAVAVVATAEHRAAAFDACRYAIDEVKRRAPIWKCERYADGKAAWKANSLG